MKPLVLLDIDGVVNDLASLYSAHHMYGAPKPDYDVKYVQSHGHIVHIPEFMPGLIQELTEASEVHWLTTWRHNANDEIVDALEIGQLPVITDGGNARVVTWKPAAAYDISLEALEAGREVWWIEDFYGQIPSGRMPRGVRFIDTARITEFPVLLPEMVPSHLLGRDEVNPEAYSTVAHGGQDEPTASGGVLGRLARFFS